MDYRNSHLSKGRNYDEDLVEEPFSVYMNRWENNILEEEVLRLFEGEPIRYLDFACGTGRITHKLERFARESIGIDVSETMLDEAKKKCSKTRFLCQDVTSSNVDIVDVDLITSFRFFGNAQNDLRLKVLEFISKTLRKDGYFIFNNHRNPNSIQFLGDKIRRKKVDVDLTYGKLKSLIENAGFSIERSYAIGWWILMYRWNNYAKKNTIINSFFQQCFKSSLFVPTSPDMVIVARKI